MPYKTLCFIATIMNTFEIVYTDHIFSLETEEFENVADTYETGHSAAWPYF